MQSSPFLVPAGTSVFGQGFSISLPLVEKSLLNHDSYIFKFGLPEGKTFGVPLGAHVKFFAKINGVTCARSYTPISDVLQRETADFVIKVYRPTAEFPQGGQMTLFLEQMKIGDFLDMKGPKCKLEYFGNGNFNCSKPNLGEISRHKLGFIAGGTGIAPCWHVLQAAVRKENCCEVSLLFANHTPVDILIKERIDELISQHSKLKVTYIVTKASEEWEGPTGHITSDVLSKYMPAPSRDTLIMFCGTKPFNKYVARTLSELGYTDEMVVKF